MTNCMLNQIIAFENIGQNKLNVDMQKVAKNVKLVGQVGSQKGLGIYTVDVHILTSV